jgi:hypothetical protein
MRFAIASALSLALCAAAFAQDMTGPRTHLIEEFKYVEGQCKTLCDGPGGSSEITTADIKVFEIGVRPNRLWLEANGKTYLLGADDHCVFEGARMSGPIEAGR